MRRMLSRYGAHERQRCVIPDSFIVPSEDRPGV
jgi:hypothetical protein